MYWPLGVPRLLHCTETPTPAPASPPIAGSTPSSPRPVDVSQPASAESDEEKNDEYVHGIIAVERFRSAQLLATLTATEVSIWQIKPTAICSRLVRSQKSLSQYGPNISLHIRPDSTSLALRTSHDYLLLYTLLHDPMIPSLQLHTPSSHSHSRSTFSDVRGVGMVDLRFKMSVKIDAGIVGCCVSDDELVVSTRSPSAVQCIPWPSSAPGAVNIKPVTEAVRRMEWIKQPIVADERVVVTGMVYDRAMDIYCFLTGTGVVYLVQRLAKIGGKAWRGHLFHDADPAAGAKPTHAVINARFSLVAVGSEDGSVQIYHIKNYDGEVVRSHSLTLRAAASNVSAQTGAVKTMAWTEDGCAIFVGYERGWGVWSVYGHAVVSSFTDSDVSRDKEDFMRGVRDAVWAGSELVMLSANSDAEASGERRRLWTLPFAYLASIPQLSSPHPLLLTSTHVHVYRAASLPHTSLAPLNPDAASTLWQSSAIPTPYLRDAGPVRWACVSEDGRYVAVAGRRGLAHFSVRSGRWKVAMPNTSGGEVDWTVRGGGGWIGHVLVVGVEGPDGQHMVRLHSRELTIEDASILHTEKLPAAIQTVTVLGDAGVLVYTHDNTLYHYVIVASSRLGSSSNKWRLQLVGQVGLSGIVHAPARVRALSWVVPEEQSRAGDPGNDALVATLTLLVDGELVLLSPRPASREGGAGNSSDQEVRYDMRKASGKVEWFALMPQVSHGMGGMRGSLWAYDGKHVKVWTDLDALDNCVDVTPSDFYPIVTLMDKALLVGIESETVQRRNLDFTTFRYTTGAHLFLHHVLRRQLSSKPTRQKMWSSFTRDALMLASRYQHLPYFEHILELLLHEILEDEADKRDLDPSEEVLPKAIGFLSNFEEFLDVVVGCARKTEVMCWDKLFKIVGSPKELFERCMEQGKYKTAGAYLVVLHTLEKLKDSSQDTVRLLAKAIEVADWDLAKELARFLMSLDKTGKTLKQALALAGEPIEYSVREDEEFMLEQEQAQESYPSPGADALGIQGLAL
ncbi:WD40 repeat protein [Saitoella coloradoensis]